MTTSAAYPDEIDTGPPALPAAEPRVAVLLLTQFPQDYAFLRAALDEVGWDVHAARTCRDAFAAIERFAIPVVVSECELPDGNWKTVLRRTDALGELRPFIIVTSRLADERLWGEVLNLGGFDVLTKPFDRAEVARVLMSARRHWSDAWERRAMHPAGR